LFSDQIKYCLDQLRRFDHDRYLAILLTPEEFRAPLCALYAFDVEMTRIPNAVSEPMLGEIRFQWWRDTLEALTPFNNPGHEIASALCETLFEGPLAPSDLLPLLDARATSLELYSHKTMAALIEHLRKTDVFCQSLALRLTGASSAEEATYDEDLALAYGMAALLRRLPQDAAHQRLSIPLDVMGENELDPHDVFAGVYRSELSGAITTLLAEASRRFANGKLRQFSGKPGQLAVMLPASLSPLYIAKMNEADFNPFLHSSEIPAFRRQLRFLRVRWMKHF